MARMIDADEAILQIERREKYLVGDLFISVDAMKEFIKNRPTIEAEPIVRCRDCAVPHNKWTGCPKLNGLVPPYNFYCAFGVRRDSDGKSD